MPVSFYADVAPIFALHCNGCHGDASGLSLRTHADLLRGGNMGRTLIAGDARNSLLIQFVDGRRGEAHRMPIGGRPLSAGQIETLRRWIDEGAKADDPARAVKHMQRLRDVKLPTQINCRMPMSGYLTIEARHPASGAVLWSETASLKSPPERNDAGAPGEWLRWKVRPAPGWPPTVHIQLTIEHVAAPADSVVFTAVPI